MGELVRAKDWSTTKLGPAEEWAQSLKTSVSFILNAAFPFILFWGDHYNVIYNDQYSPIFGGKHPNVLGSPGYEAWPEVWDVIGPMLDEVRGGTATWSENQMLELSRNGYLEECYFTWSYSPVRVEDGTVGGVMTPIQETTKTVISERRLNLLRELAANTANTQSEDEACTLVTRVWRLTIRFASLRSYEMNKAPGLWTKYSLNGAASKYIKYKRGLGHIPGGICEHTPTTEAIVLPLETSANQEPIGLVVFGLNPRRELDSDYKDFLELARAQLAASVLRGRSLTEKQQRLQALAEIDRAKSVFFSNISHEYRTPLSLILAPVADLLNDPTLNAQQLSKIKLVERNAQRLHKLVNSVLDFSQLEAGRTEGNFRLTDMSVATANAASMFRSAMEKGNLAYTVETPPLGEMVYLDVDMWEKIVLNLISNAFKYTVKGGVKVRVYKNGTAAYLEVEDTGCGVPENDIDRLFERFHRCQSSGGRSVEGTGIGLSLTHELVKLHGGTISATSTLDVGTKFTVSIPLGRRLIPSSQIVTAQEPVDHQPPQSSTGRAFIQESARWVTKSSSLMGSSSDNPDESFSVGTSANEDTFATGSSDPGPFNDTRMARVVLADDNADMREYVGSLLAKFCIVHVANDGRHAYEAIMQNPPDLILRHVTSYDVMMPHMNGFELLQKIREQPHLKQIPFVLLSARAGEEAKVEGLQAGADDYLVKPFSAKELRARVRTQIALGRMRKELERLVQARTAELQESARQFQLLSNITPVGITRMNVKGEVVFVNRAWWEIIGRDPSKDDPNDWQSWVKPETVDVANDLMSGGRADTGSASRRETTIIRPDGTEVTVIGTCVFDDGSAECGQPHEFTGGETERKEKMNQLIEDHEAIDAISMCTNHQEVITNDVLQLSKLKQQKLMFNPVICAPEVVISRVMRMFRTIMRKKRIDFAWHLSVKSEGQDFVQPSSKFRNLMDADLVFSEPDRLAQIMFNLVTNAIKFTEKSCNEKIITIALELTNSVIGTESEAGSGKELVTDVKVSVKDTGIGMSESEQQKLFQRFSQASVKTYSTKRGCRVAFRILFVRIELFKLSEPRARKRRLRRGSAASHLISTREAAASTPHCSSTNGRTSVTSNGVNKPQRSPSPSQSSTPKPPQRKQRQKEYRLEELRVLIVEDNMINQKVLRKQLDKEGVTTEVANNGLEAVEHFTKGNFSVIIMDVEMPIMDGLEATRQIRALESSDGSASAVPILGLRQFD
ncbi:hypothetical protein HDU86_005189 [Geranomyces michiganensis]|nr:hypothetical protein HDU86_005189 [Geranomyces michiganensis]